jgi:poly(A) polymerase Pap1
MCCVLVPFTLNVRHISSKHSIACLEEKPEVTEVIRITTARVPLMKFKFDGVQIDLVCAKMNLTNILEIFDHMVVNYNQINSNSVHSLNGYYRRLKFFFAIYLNSYSCNCLQFYLNSYSCLYERMVQQLNLLCELLINVQMAAEVVISFFIYLFIYFSFLCIYSPFL